MFKQHRTSFRLETQSDEGKSRRLLPRSRRLSGLQGSSRPASFLRAHSPLPRSSSSSARLPRPTPAVPNMVDTDMRKTRADRTFVGASCAFCEEPLEHMLRGEHILQLSCNHVAHEACFHEVIKDPNDQFCPMCDALLGVDSSRGGSLIDTPPAQSAVGGAMRGPATSAPSPLAPQQQQLLLHQQQQAYAQPPLIRPDRNSQLSSSIMSMSQRTWDGATTSSHAPRAPSYMSDPASYARGFSSGVDSASSTLQHYRNDSAFASPIDYGVDGGPLSGPPSAAIGSGRRYRRDSDVPPIEADIAPQPILRRPIAAPIVTVRSEFPTMTRSRQQQPLTCLVTVEVPAGSWTPAVHEARFPTPIQEELPHQLRPATSSGPSAPAGVPIDPLVEDVIESLRVRVENWHGLEFNRFGRLRLYGVLRVGKDKTAWQELECYLFSEMLICVKDKRNAAQNTFEDPRTRRQLTRCALKGSILMKKHLRQVESFPDEPILTLHLSAPELPCFNLKFPSRSQLETWKRALVDLDSPTNPLLPDDVPSAAPPITDLPTVDPLDYRNSQTLKRTSSAVSSSYAVRSQNTALTDYSTNMSEGSLLSSLHVPLDLVVVVPVYSSILGVKVALLRDAVKFLVHSLGPRDRLSLVTVGSTSGGVPQVGMMTKAWPGWDETIKAIKPVGQKSLRGDVVEGANVAMDLLMQRRFHNPLAAILLVSDSSTSETESVDFVVSRAEAAKVGIYSFGLGLTHKPDIMIELSARTKASYTYIKDWMMLRECVAGVLGSLQTTSHQNTKLKLHLPDGSPARFAKISGALHTTKRATGRDAEAALGDLRFGDRRDVLVQLIIPPDNTPNDQAPQDAWESIVSGLEALGGALDSEDIRPVSIEELPLIQADLTYGDVLRDGHLAHSPRPTLLAISMLPTHSKHISIPFLPMSVHPSIVQRRMELLVSDMLSRALTLVSRGQTDGAYRLLSETRSIINGLGKGGLPPLPPLQPLPPTPGLSKLAESPVTASNGSSPRSSSGLRDESTNHQSHLTAPPAPTSNPSNSSFNATNINGTSANNSDLTNQPLRATSPLPQNNNNTVDPAVLNSLDADVDAALEWIRQPAVFSRDSRKAVLQTIGVISSQRGYTQRTLSESHFAERVDGIRRQLERSREWRDSGDDALTEE